MFKAGKKRNELLIARTIQQLAKALDISQPTAIAALGHLASLRIVSEASGKKRDRIFHYDTYLAILRADTEPLK